jgi:sugar phosphate isomerase/epimerase
VPAIGSKIDEVRVDGDIGALKVDLDYYAKIGIEAVELPVHGLDAIKNGSLDKRRLSDVERVLRDFSFVYSVHAPNPLNLMDQEVPDLHLSVFRSSLEFAERIDAGVLVYHAGRFVAEETFLLNGRQNPSFEEQKRLLERERERLVHLSEEFPDTLICVENARPYLFHSPYCYAENLCELKEEVVGLNRPNVKITLDIGHLHMAAHFYNFDLIHSVHNAGGLIAHTHVHDNFGGAVYHHEKTQTHQIPFGRGDAHMPVGWGATPIAEILGTYLHDYDGMLIMELRSRYFSSVEESKDYLTRIVRSLKAKPKQAARAS